MTGRFVFGLEVTAGEMVGGSVEVGGLTGFREGAIDGTLRGESVGEAVRLCTGALDGLNV